MSDSSGNMKVKQVEFDFINGKPGKTSHGNHDWDLAQQHSSFANRGVCEFIFQVSPKPFLKRLEDHGFSRAFLDTMKKAKSEGFTYVCLYSYNLK